jgi:hypothetical protein
MIGFSEIESEVFGLKTGRINADSFDGEALLHEIQEQGYDLIRIKAPTGFDAINVELDKTGYPFYFAGAVRQLYFKDLTEPTEQLAVNKDLTMELYDGSQREQLWRVIRASYMMYPLGYYKTPVINKIISKDKEIEAMCRYFEKYFISTDYPDNFIWFMKRGEEYVGLAALHFRRDEQTMECPLGAVIPDAQNSGVFYDIIKFCRYFSWQQDARFIEAGMRSENLISQHVFLKHINKEGMVLTGDKVDYVFHLLPMLSKQKSM